MADTFIARYGRVRYTSKLSRRYPRTGQCEVGLCRIYAAESLAGAQRHKAAAERELARLEAARARLAARAARLLAWSTRTEVSRRRRRRELDLARYQLRVTGEQITRLRERTLPGAELCVTSAMAAAEPQPLVFEHCHAHGWVRGLVCAGCNMRIASLETLLESPSRRYEAVLFGFLKNCPGCGPGYQEQLRRQIAQRRGRMKREMAERRAAGLDDAPEIS